MSFNLREEIVRRVWIRSILPQLRPQVPRNQLPQTTTRKRQ